MSLVKAHCLPHDCGCEFVKFGIISQPSAFYSSFFYLLSAFILYKKINLKTRELKLWVSSLVILGLSSLWAHGSLLELALTTDFASIIFVIGLFPLLRLTHKRMSFTVTLLAMIVLYIGLAFILYQMNKWIKVSICVGVFGIALAELIHYKGRDFYKDQLIKKSLLILVSSFALFLLSEMKIVCWPESWFQGHSVWHLGTSVSLYFYGKWRLTS